MYIACSYLRTVRTLIKFRTSQKPRDVRDRGLCLTLPFPHFSNRVFYVNDTDMPKFGSYDFVLVVTYGLTKFTRVFPCTKHIIAEELPSHPTPQRRAWAVSSLPFPTQRPYRASLLLPCPRNLGDAGGHIREFIAEDQWYYLNVVT